MTDRVYKRDREKEIRWAEWGTGQDGYVMRGRGHRITYDSRWPWHRRAWSRLKHRRTKTYLYLRGGS